MLMHGGVTPHAIDNANGEGIAPVDDGAVLAQQRACPCRVTWIKRMSICVTNKDILHEVTSRLSACAGEVASTMVRWLVVPAALSGTRQHCLTTDDRAGHWPRMPRYRDHRNGAPQG